MSDLWLSATVDGPPSSSEHFNLEDLSNPLTSPRVPLCATAHHSTIPRSLCVCGCISDKNLSENKEFTLEGSIKHLFFSKLNSLNITVLLLLQINKNLPLSTDVAMCNKRLIWDNYSMKNRALLVINQITAVSLTKPKQQYPQAEKHWVYSLTLVHEQTLAWNYLCSSELFFSCSRM